ncbi:cardiolipin synthase [Veronia nyctiphanis]|uniref:Cardiolipin synthase A n=1 Tax=Veronia nyctiphanis TaxID=1278244 RepID=A0A4Q0Z0B6_9GAMM|nr:cardiolipin synthase [Veronia nyctiphanis]RXJ74869.1 cardiolipin synthase [Veronia nyctiphanis]
MEKFFQIVSWAGLFLYWLLIASVTVRVVFRRRAPGVSIAWLMVIYILPILGVFLYLLVGELNLGKKRAERAKAMFSSFESWLRKLRACTNHAPQLLNQQSRNVSDLCFHRLGIPALAGNSMELKDNPAKILSAIETDIASAKTHINMVFYIWYPGGDADRVAQAICDAAHRGVAVRVMLDSAGSKEFFKSPWPSEMRDAGVELIEALSVSPLRMFFRRLDIRQHRKIVVIDNNIAYTGSMNMVDPRFFKQNAGVGQWVDIMVRLTGPAVPVINSVFSWDWEVETGIRDLPPLPECDVAAEKATADDPHAIQVIPSGPGMPDGVIQQVLMLAIHQAQRSITITTPYLIPSESLLNALRTTAERGVKVNLIIPAKNDSLMVDWASRSFFSELMLSGILIYRFDGGLLHTKSVVIDEEFCFIGTVNLDMRSLWLNFELTIAVEDPEFCQQLVELQKSYTHKSEILDFDMWQKRSVVNKPIEQFFYMFAPLL